MNLAKPKTSLPTIVAAGVTLLSAPAIIGQTGKNLAIPTTDAETLANGLTEASIYDEIWSLPVLYEDERNPWLQRFRLKGRYQGQYALVESNKGSYDDWEHRRARIGFEAEMFHRVTIGATIDLNMEEDLGPLYEELTSAAIEIALTDSTTLAIGKIKPRWSWEWDTSSKRMVTFERTLLNNQIKPSRATGLGLSGTTGHWTYQTGIFSGDLNEEFGDLDGGWFTYGSLAYDLSESAEIDLLVLRGDYLYNDPKIGDTAAKPYQHSLAASVMAADGPWTWNTEALYATGFNPDVFGISSVLTYWLQDEKWEAVLRYQYAHGDDDSLRVQKRYERAVPNLTDGGNGEEYHACYAGLNRYFYGHKLKVMMGVEWADMDGGDDGGSFDGWTGLAGIRLYF